MQPTADSPPSSHRLLVVTVDRLPAWMLSTWGATWVATPAFDALAARGIVFDRVITTSLDPRETVRELLGAGAASILARAADAGRRVAVVTDQPAITEAIGMGHAAHATLVAATCPAEPATAEAATNLGRLFAAASHTLAECRPDVLWVHAGSLGIAWDAPSSFRERYLDPDDPPPPPGAAVPNAAVDASVDPDLLVALRHVFAAQITLLDQCLGSLLEAAGPDLVVLVAGLRGMPLGVHDWIGGEGIEPDARPPYGESIHVPAILVDAAGRMAGQRYGGLAIPADLGATIAELSGIGAEIPGREPWHGRSFAALFSAWRDTPRDRVVVRAPVADALVTCGWHLIDGGVGGESGCRMIFSKPDDFFEKADVADRCRSVAEELAGLLERGGGQPCGAWRKSLSEAAQTSG